VEEPACLTVYCDKTKCEIELVRPTTASVAAAVVRLHEMADIRELRLFHTGSGTARHVRYGAPRRRFHPGCVMQSRTAPYGTASDVRAATHGVPCRAGSGVKEP